jgi:hypothetical protein
VFQQEFRMSQFKLPPRTASVSDLLDAATVVFRSTLAKALPAALFAMLLAGLAGMYLMTTGKMLDFRHPPLDPRFWMFAAIGLVFYQWLAAIVMLRQRAMMDGTAPDLQRESSAALRRWPMLIATYVLESVAVSAGLLPFVIPGVNIGVAVLAGLLLVIPGIYLGVCLVLLRPVVLFESVGPVQALVRCVHLVRPMWSRVLAAAVIALLIFLVCTVAAGACLGIVHAVATTSGVQEAAFDAFSAACQLGIDAVALVYFNALWLVLYSVASSSA